MFGDRYLVTMEESWGAEGPELTLLQHADDAMCYRADVKHATVLVQFIKPKFHRQLTPEHKATPPAWPFTAAEGHRLLRLILLRMLTGPSFAGGGLMNFPSFLIPIFVVDAAHWVFDC